MTCELHKTRVPTWKMATAVLLTGAVGVSPIARAEGNPACSLLTADELATVLDGKPSRPQGRAGAQSGGEVALCSAETSGASVLLRLAKKSGRAPGAAAKGIAIAKQMGAQVEVRTFGPITCSTMTPPKSLEAYGYNTTCSVDRGSQVAAVEVTAKSRKDMVPIDKLRRLAEKMTGRF